MLEESIYQVNTKLKALKLIYDPTVLMSLLYSKYGDIEEDYELLYTNQLIYDRSSRFNVYFKEYQFYHSDEEFLKRFYRKNETKVRIPKLSEYYKNYHLFFCRPRFSDYIISNIMQSFEDDKAELFYKKNFEDTNSKDDELKHKSQSSLSSLDNLTDNKIIFTQKAKKIIDKSIESKIVTITLSTNSINNNEKNGEYEGLISARNNNDSFELIVHNLIHYKKTKKKPIKNKSETHNFQKPKSKNNQQYYFKKDGKNLSSNRKEKSNYNYSLNNNKDKLLINKISLFSLIKQANKMNLLKMSRNKEINGLFTPKLNTQNGNFSTKFEEFHKNLIKLNKNVSQHKKMKSFNINQNHISGINGSHTNNQSNYTNINNNVSRNDFKTMKLVNYKKMTKLNNFLLTNNNNNNNNQKKTSHIKNQTFDNSSNVFNNLVSKYPTKIFPGNNNNLNNQIILKKNIKSKGGMAKSPLNMNINGKIYLTKNNNNKNNNNNNLYKYYNSKFSHPNNFYKNLISNPKINLISNNKKYKNYLSTMTQTTPKNNPTSPIAAKLKKEFNSKNKSDNINSKIKPKIGKGRINNLNINFNNVIFNAPLSHINENINFNSNIINNNNSTPLNLMSITNNNNSSHTNNNISEVDNHAGKNVYIMNLKNMYNISRNRIGFYGGKFSQTENISASKTKGKLITKSRNIIVNHTYANLLSNNNKNIKAKMIIKKSGNKSGTRKLNSKKKKNVTNTIKVETMNNSNTIYKSKNNLKSEEGHFLKNCNRSPNGTGRSHQINVNRSSNFNSKKVMKIKKSS